MPFIPFSFRTALAKPLAEPLAGGSVKVVFCMKLNNIIKVITKDIVNQWLLVPTIQCQQEPPIWGVVKKEILFSDNLTVRQPWGQFPSGSTALRCSSMFCSVLLCSVWVCFTLFWFTLLWSLLFCASLLCSSETSSVFQLSQGFSIESESTLSKPEGNWHI